MSIIQKNKSLDYYLEGLTQGNRYILSEAITLVESTNPEKNNLGLEIISKLPPNKKTSLRIGITGSPGVGKSTFLDTFGMFLIKNGYKIAILAIDPSSQNTKGSILGDKTRMERISKNQNAYIRPTPSGQFLGGIAANTYEAMLLCEATGYDIVLVETVGVGQSETMVSSMVDLFLLLIMPGSGDDIQGIKRGIMELADLIVVNKADGERVTLANKSKKQFENALSLLQHKVEGWKPKVITCSSLMESGIEEVWKTSSEYVTLLKDAGHYIDQRLWQEKNWFDQKSKKLILDEFLKHTEMHALLAKLNHDITNKKIKPIDAVIKLKSSLSLTMKNIIK